MFCPQVKVKVLEHDSKIRLESSEMLHHFDSCV